MLWHSAPCCVVFLSEACERDVGVSMGMLAMIHSGLEDLAEKKQDREAGKPGVMAREKPVMNPGVQAGRGKSGEEGVHRHGEPGH